MFDWPLNVVIDTSSCALHHLQWYILQGPEIRTGFLENEQPVKLTTGKVVTITTDYEQKGNDSLVAMSYKKLAEDVKVGQTILIADGSISLQVRVICHHVPVAIHIPMPAPSWFCIAPDIISGTPLCHRSKAFILCLQVLSTDPAKGTVQAKCLNSAVLGERKNVNLPGVIVDLPTLTEKDIDDLTNWGVPNEIDLIAASFVRKGSDLDYIRKVREISNSSRTVCTFYSSASLIVSA